MRTAMNEKEEFKKAVIECCISGTMTVKQAADRLGFSERYVKELKARYKKYGASSMLHGNCGRQPKYTIPSVKILYNFIVTMSNKIPEVGCGQSPH